MNRTVTFLPTTLEAIAPLRERYLDSLPHAQEPKLEVLIPGGEHYFIVDRDGTAGYLVVHEGALLVEFFLEPNREQYCHAILIELIRKTAVRRVWVKTFDHLLHSHAIDLAGKVTCLGCLARRYERQELPEVPGLSYVSRPGVASDVPQLLAVEGNVFNHPDRLRAVIERGFLTVYERDGELVGFGILRPVRPGHPEVELGLVVTPRYRNRGYALFLLRDLADECVSRGLAPIAGVALANSASWKMGLRVGMRSVHRLLEIELQLPV